MITARVIKWQETRLRSLNRFIKFNTQSAFKSIDVKETNHPAAPQASRSKRIFDETTSFILITSSKSMLHPTKQKENLMQGNLKYDE